MNTEVYGEEYARIYDLFYQGKDYLQEVDFIEDILRGSITTPSPRVLELACGTGRHLSELAKRGFQMTGLDKSQSMLDRAQKRLNNLGQQAPLHCQDMTNFVVQGEKFHAVLCLFDALGYSCSNEAILSTLAQIRNHTLPSGIVIFDFWHAAAMQRDYDPCRLREVRDNKRSILRISETSLDAKTQLGTVKYTFIADSSTGCSKWEEIHQGRYFGVAEMDLFLKVSGFSKWVFYPGFTKSPHITGNDWHVVVVASI